MWARQHNKTAVGSKPTRKAVILQNTKSQECMTKAGFVDSEVTSGLTCPIFW